MVDEYEQAALDKAKVTAEEMRLTREGIRKAKEKAATSGESLAEKGWPPAWCVTFSDMMTLLMCFFVLWYALTAMQLPPELLTIKTVQTLFPKADELRKTLQLFETEKKETEEKPLYLTPQDTNLLLNIKNFLTMVNNAEGYLKEQGMIDKVRLTVTPDEVVITPVDSVLFKKGSVNLRPEIYGLLDMIIGMLKNSAGAVRVEGHTDDTPIGPFSRNKYASNWELSSARAMSAASYLIEGGISPARISVSGYGPSKPIAANINEENRAKNRRVEFHISIPREKPSG